MCGGNSPPPPDPTATALAQNQVNEGAIKTSAQYNQINQNNPFGSMSYTGDLGSPDRTQNVTLNPQLQQLLNGQTGNANLLTQMGGNLINATGNIAPFNPGANPAQYANMGDITPMETARQQDVTPLQTSFAAPTTGTVDHVNQGQIQTQLDRSGVQRIMGPNAFAPQINQQAQAAYQAQTGLLAPHEQQAQSQLQSQLAAQGIEQGTPAYNNAINNLQQSQDLIRQQAAASATGQGLQAQGQLFGENLQGSQAQFQQALQSGQFGNEAQALSFGQGMSNAQLANQVNQQQFGQNQAQAQFYNDAQQQMLAEHMGVMQADNQANQQSLQEHLQVQNANQALYQQNFGNQQAGQTQNLNALMALNNGQQIAPNQPSFNPFAQSQAAQASPNAIGLAGSNYGYQSQAQGGLLGSIFGGLGNLGSAAILACWVAREVYGEDNPRWLQMRHWMLTKAPHDLRTMYLRTGERIAEFIKDKPLLKAEIRAQMEAVLG